MNIYYIYFNLYLIGKIYYKINGDWGLGIGDWGLGRSEERRVGKECRL